MKVRSIDFSSGDHGTDASLPTAAIVSLSIEEIALITAVLGNLDPSAVAGVLGSKYSSAIFTWCNEANGSILFPYFEDGLHSAPFEFPRLARIEVHRS